MKKIKIIRVRLRQLVRSELLLVGIIFLLGLIVFLTELYMKWFPSSF